MFSFFLYCVVDASIDASLKYLFVVAASEETQRPPPWWQADGSWTQSIHRHPWRSLVVALEVTNLQWHPWNWCSKVPHVSASLIATFVWRSNEWYNSCWYCQCSMVLMDQINIVDTLAGLFRWYREGQNHRYYQLLEQHALSLFPSTSHGAPLDDTTLQWLPCNTWAPLEDTNLQWHSWNSCRYRYSNIVDRPMSTLLLRVNSGALGHSIVAVPRECSNDSVTLTINVAILSHG
jgi:hypothetical protein